MLLTAQPKARVSAEMHQLVQPHMAGTTRVPGTGKDPEQRGLRDLCQAAVSTGKNALQSLNACVPHTSALRPVVFHDGVIVGRHPPTQPLLPLSMGLRRPPKTLVLPFLCGKAGVAVRTSSNACGSLAGPVPSGCQGSAKAATLPPCLCGSQ